jgi:hypothetical protein
MIIFSTNLVAGTSNDVFSLSFIVIFLGSVSAAAKQYPEIH